MFVLRQGQKKHFADILFSDRPPDDNQYSKSFEHSVYRWLIYHSNFIPNQTH